MAEQDYITNTYNALKSKVQGFDKTPEQYRDLVLNDADYRGKVHAALKQKVQGFDRTMEDFDAMLGVKKKAYPNLVLSRRSRTLKHPVPTRLPHPLYRMVRHLLKGALRLLQAMLDNRHPFR